ncbi:hypothetical protein Y788_06380 [Pantoea dispersa 625]|nr:hypothetical protein Y788_06380 [Pantoea dispersa 625]
MFKMGLQCVMQLKEIAFLACCGIDMGGHSGFPWLVKFLCFFN